MGFELVLGQVISGLVRSSFLFLVTIGLTLIYGVLGVLNLAHVSFYMLGAYVTVSAWRLFQAYAFAYWISILATCLVMAAIGLFIELVLMRRLYSHISSEILLATFALIYIFSDLAKLAWGVGMYSIPKPAILANPIATVGMASFPASSAFALGVSVLVGLCLWFWLNKTKYGNIIRAVQSDREAVSVLGIAVPRIYSFVFALSALLAGLAGAVWMATGIVQPGSLDNAMLPQLFCVMVIGGLGSLAGTGLASVVIGLTFALSILVIPKAGMVSIFAVTGLILLIRPWGLMGSKERTE